MADKTVDSLVAASIARDKDLQAKAAIIIAAAIAILDESEPPLRIMLQQYLAQLTLPGINLSSPVVQAQINQMKADVSAIRTRYLGDVSDHLFEQTNEVIDDEWKFLTATYAAIAGIQLLSPDGTSIPEILATPFLGRSFAQWMDDMAVADATRITDAVVTGLIQQQDAHDILTTVLGTQQFDGADGRTQITRNNLRSVIDSGIVSVASQAMEDLSEENEQLLPTEVYVAVLDDRTTEICRSYNGQIFPTGEGPIPPLHFNCRSRRVPIPAGGDASGLTDEG